MQPGFLKKDSQGWVMKKISLYWNVSLILFFVMMGCITTGDDDIYRDPLWPDIDLSLYQSYQIDWNNVRPAMPTDYWEMRSRFGHTNTQITVTVGDKCSKALDRQACTTEFDALRADSSFGNLICSDSTIYWCQQQYYIVSNFGNENRIWDTLDKLKAFLGTIDSKEEALLLARGHGFFTSGAVSVGNRFGANATNGPYWGAVAYADMPAPPLHGGIREIDGEYELIVAKAISVCMPRQENRYLIRIKPSGDLVILREQINERDDDHPCR